MANSVPTLTGLTTPVTFLENTVNAAPQIIAADVTFTDPDNNFDAGTLTVTGLLAQDTVAIRNQGTGAGQIGVSGGNVSFGGSVIGSFAGGAGSTFAVTFNAAATAAGIEALIENLTYANSSDTPTASRSLELNVTDAAGFAAIAPLAFAEQTGATNPFDGVDVGTFSAPSFADLDGDGDLDAVVGDGNGTLHYFENTGSAIAPAFTARTGAANPLNGVDVGVYSTPSFADLDGDGDLDAVVGEFNGTLHYFENTGSAMAPAFTARTGAANPFNGVDVGSFSTPSFADLDGDGDLDAVVGENDGNLNYFENTGTASAPAFTEQTGTANPFDGVNVGFSSAPSFADLDGDGDLDGVVGDINGSLNYFENTGTAIAPAFTARTGVANPFDGVDVGTFSAPSFADLDGDGDLDAVVGEGDGNLNYFRYTSAPDFAEQTGAANPFNGVDVGFNSTPSFADLDGDGDLDAVVGAQDGTLNYFENTGTATAPAFTGPANPLNGVNVGAYSTPSFADLDGDGDLDAVVGEDGGTLNYFENTGSASAPAFTARTGAANPFDGVDVGARSTPSFADLDGDGDLDAVVGEAYGSLNYFENTGTAIAPAFTARTGAANPFDGVDVGFNSAPSFADLDGDGDLDAVVGAYDGTLHYFENTGSASAPAFTARTGAANPFDGVVVGARSTPSFADLDGDGDLDAVVGETDGVLHYFENTGSGFALVVNVTAQNDAAVLSPDVLNLTETNAAAAISASGTLTISDVDSAATFVAQAGTLGSYGTFAITSAGGWTYTASSAHNEFAAGTTYTDTFQVASADGTPTSVTINIAGTNDAAVLSTDVRNLTETNAAADISSSGTLTISNSDSAASFVAQAGTLGSYGTFAITSAGAWTYTASSAHNEFAAGTTYTDTFQVASADGTPTSVTINIAGTNDAAVLSTDVRNLTETNAAADISSSGTLTISDSDSAASFVAQAGTLGSYGTFAITSAGAWTYTASSAHNEFAAGTTYTDTFQVASADGTSTSVTINIAGSNDAAVLSADVRNLTETNAAADISASGTFTISDADSPATFVAQAGTLGSYGTFAITSAGAWTYTASSAHNEFAAGTTYTDTFQVASADGTSTSVTINIAGTADAANSVPTLTGLTTPVTFLENTVNAAPQIIAADVTFTDPDNNFDGGTLTVTGLLAQDTVAIRNQGTGAGQIGISGGDVSFGGSVIGSFAGGSGSTLTVTFNAAATAAGIEALIENLTYANSSDAPAASRSFELKVTDAAGFAATIAPLAEQTGAANPFNGLDVGNLSTPSFADLDGDGDLDALVGAGDGTLNYFENTGSATAPAFTEQTGAANPLNGVDVGTNNTPSFADLDGDGDLDAVVGERFGTLHYFQNTGTATAPVFTERAGAANPFNGVDAGSYSTPSFADLDGDGDLDAVVGELYGTLHYFENTGSATAPAFTERTGAANPFNGVDVGNRSAPSFADLDGDRDLDAVVGEGDGTLNYFENTGSAIAPAFTARTGAANPINVDVGRFSAPSFADFDGDGELDAVVGEIYGFLRYFLNTTPPAPDFAEQTGAANPFNTVDVGAFSTPSFADLDGDGDLDAVVGDFTGALRYFENTGSAIAPVFTQQTGVANPFNGVDVGGYSTPSFADLDGDGDLDAVVGEFGGTLRYFENTGSATAPAFTERTGAANPFNGIGVGFFSTPSFADLDGDGDLDAVVGTLGGTLRYFENTGSATAPAFAERTGAANPFDGVDVGNRSAPSFADLDGDGDLDAVIGEQDGNLNYFRNTGSGFTLVVDVTAQNDAAALSADVRNLTETNAAADISSSGTLTISDVDSPTTFVAQAGTVGLYGTFAINTAGAWTYTASSAHDEFAAGTTYTDTFSVAGSDGTLTSVTINIAGSNDAADLSADVRDLTEANTAAAISSSGTLTISDVDSAASFVAQAGVAGLYGTFAIDSAGAWTYAASSAHNEFAAGTTHTDTFSVASADGTLTSVTVNIAGSNDTPVANAQGIGTDKDTAVPVMLSGSDADGDSLAFTVLSGPAHGTLSGSGANRTYTPDPGYLGPDSFSYVANDGTLNSAPATVSLNVHLNIAPVVTAFDQSAARGQIFNASNLFSATDGDGDALLYFFYDNSADPASGHFTVNGVVQAANTTFAVNTAQLAQTTFMAGQLPDDLFVNAWDGSAFSGPQEFHINVPVNRAPTATAHDESATRGQVFSASDLFSASDADGDNLLYFFYDNSADPASGHFTVNGAVQAAGTTFAVTQAQLAQTTFTAGAGTSDDLFVNVYDGTTFSGPKEFHVNIPANQAPTVTASDFSASKGQVVNASTLFSANDANGDSLLYFFYDNSADPASGHFTVNGVVQAAGTTFAVTAAQLAQTTFTAGLSASDDLFVNVYDGSAFSGPKEFHVNVPANQAPTVTASNQTATSGQVLNASSLFSANDVDGDSLLYFFYDNSAAPTSGHFDVNGVVQAAGTTFAVTQAQLAQTHFVAGTTGDDLFVNVWDQASFSGPKAFHIDVV